MLALTSELQWFWDQLDKYLAQNHLKQTHQRKIIVEEFLNLNSHVEAEILYATVRNRAEGLSIGLATVYRTLNLLKDAGLANQSTFADGRAVFELAKPGKHHDHLVCLSCGRIVEFENEAIESLQVQIAESYGFQLVSHKLELYGYCQETEACKGHKES